MNATMNRPTPMITALIPAHNEGGGLAATIDSLRGQTMPPSRVLVVSDNSTDDTVAVALAAGADVMETSGNSARKAGALNQGLPYVDTPYVLVMDADTRLVPTWVQDALGAVQAGADAVGAVFTADSDSGWLRGCQAREWYRYAEEIDRTGKVFVLSGTAALIRTDALVAIGGYDETSITEDFAATVRLKEHGYRLASPVACTSITETMPTVADLFRQRRRWSLGAIQTVARAGLHPHTRVYWLQQILLAVSIAAMASVILLTTLAAVTGQLVFTALGAALFAVFAAERIYTVFPMGRRHAITAACVIPELAYSLVLQAAHVAALYQAARRQSGAWGHIQTTTKD